MKQKQLYTAPEAETLVVRFEANIMSPQYGDSGQAGSIGGGNVYDFGDDD